MAIRIGEVKSSSLSDDKKEVRAKGAFGPAADSAADPSVTVAPRPERNGGAGANPDQIRFEIPKNFTVTADTSGRGLVLLILNHRLQNQEGYALSPDAAKQVAGGLTKSAEAVLALKPPAPPLN